MRVLFLVNPVASSVTARRQVIIHKLLTADHEVERVDTTHRGHATELAADAARSGFEAVVVMGGDGTLNEAANGLAGTSTALVALPGGSTNVFARTIGLSDDPIEATMSMIEAMNAGEVKRIGLGSVNGRYFLFHTGVGWDARLVRQVEKRDKVKKYASHPLFIWCGLETFFGLYDRKNPHFSITYEDGVRVDGGYFSVILNTNPYTYVGTTPFSLSPDATLDRPLAAVTMTKMKSLSFLRLMFATLRSPDATTRSSIVDYRADLFGATIEAYHPTPYQVDGDDCGDEMRLEFLFHPEALNLVMPLQD